MSCKHSKISTLFIDKTKKSEEEGRRPEVDRGDDRPSGDKEAEGNEKKKRKKNKKGPSGDKL